MNVTTLADIKAAAESLSPAEQQELLCFLTTGLRCKDQPNPEFLYRYRSLRTDEDRAHVERILVAQQIRFSSAANFNDPYDCKVSRRRDVSDADVRSRLTMRCRAELRSRIEAKHKNRVEKIFADGPSESEVEQYVEELWPSRNKIIDDDENLIQKYLDNSGLLSLSEVDDDILMWSHYADGHRGLCLRFRRDALQFPNGIVEKVSYPEQYPRNVWIGSPSTAWYGAWVLSKSRHWCYEREWRVILQPKPPEWEDTKDTLTQTLYGRQKLPPNALAGVVLGCDVSPKDKQRVHEWCRLTPQPVPVFFAKKKPNRYELEIEAV